MSWHPDGGGGGGGRPPVPPGHKSGDRHSLTYAASTSEGHGPPAGEAEAASASQLSGSHGNYMNYQSLQNLNTSAEPQSSYNHHSSNSAAEPHSGVSRGLPASTSWHAGVSTAASNHSLSSSASSASMAPGPETRLRKGYAYSIGALECSPGEKRREKLELAKESRNFPGSSPVHSSKSAYDLRSSDTNQDGTSVPGYRSKQLMGSSWNRPGPYKAANYENVEAAFDYSTSSVSAADSAQPLQGQSPSAMTTSYYMAERERLLGHHSSRHRRSVDGGAPTSLQLSSAGETDLDAPQSPPPAPPMRDGSSLRYIRSNSGSSTGGTSNPGNGGAHVAGSANAHERFSSWPAAPVTTSSDENQRLSASMNVRTSWSPNLPSSQEYKLRGSTYQSGMGVSRVRQENPKLKILKDALDYPQKGALAPDGDRLTKSFSLDFKKDFEGKPTLYSAYPFSSSVDAKLSSFSDANKENYVEMAPAVMDTDYKEVKLEKRFTDIPFIAKDLVRRESLRESESSTPPPLPNSPPPLPVTSPPLPSHPPQSSQHKPMSAQSFTSNNSSNSAVATTGVTSPLHSTYSTYIVRQTKPYYNTSTQTEEVNAAMMSQSEGAAQNRPSVGVATDDAPPQVECRSVQVGSHSRPTELIERKGVLNPLWLLQSLERPVCKFLISFAFHWQ